MLPQDTYFMYLLYAATSSITATVRIKINSLVRAQFLRTSDQYMTCVILDTARFLACVCQSVVDIDDM